MLPEVFYNYLCDELRQNRDLYPYYKLVDGSSAQQQFRKAYFLQRLNYINNNIDTTSNPVIWDCGCGYGTTGLFFAINNQPVLGTTLEYYAKEWEKRCSFWNNLGNTSLFSYKYANLFDEKFPNETFDYIILQDTLHHIEPLDEALKIFHRVLKKNGKIILIEENGDSFIKRLILYKQRGNNRIISVYDEVLGKEILMGNENIRSAETWCHHFHSNGFRLLENSVNFIRLLPPFFYSEKHFDKTIEKEQKISQRSKFLRNKFFFGLNMVFEKQN